MDPHLVAVSEVRVLEIRQVLPGVISASPQRDRSNRTYLKSVLVIVDDRTVGLSLGGDLLFVSTDQEHSHDNAHCGECGV